MGFKSLVRPEYISQHPGKAIHAHCNPRSSISNVYDILGHMYSHVHASSHPLNEDKFKKHPQN